MELKSLINYEPSFLLIRRTWRERKQQEFARVSSRHARWTYKKEKLLVVSNTHHYIFDLEISDNEIWKILFRNWIHNVVLVFSRVISGPVFVTVVLMGETRGVIYIPSVENK